MKQCIVGQFTTSRFGAKRAAELLDRYGIDYAITGETGSLFSPSCDVIILKPDAKKVTPERLFSFMMKFDNTVRIGKQTHSLTAEQIDLLKSCDKVKLLKSLDTLWDTAMRVYVYCISIFAQAYAIANEEVGSDNKFKDNKDAKLDESNNSGQIRANMTSDTMKEFLDGLPDDIYVALTAGIHEAVQSSDPGSEYRCII